MIAKKYLYLGGFGLLLALGVYIYMLGGKHERLECDSETNTATIQVLTHGKTVSNTINSVPSDDLDRRLSYWVSP